MFKIVATSLIAVSLLPSFAQADEAAVRKLLEGKAAKIEKVVKSPVAGLWEVSADNQVFYVDDAGKYLVVGNLIEGKSGRNITNERQFAMLPLEFAMKQVRGDGKQMLVTFEDPNCGYCKKLARDMQQLKNVTIYTFLYPVLGDDSVEKSKAIWCSTDKAKAWNDWMISGKAPAAASPKCDLAGLERSAETGQRMRVNGTPAIFFGNGERAGGYIPLPEIEKRMAAVANATAGAN